MDNGIGTPSVSGVEAVYDPTPYERDVIDTETESTERLASDFILGIIRQKNELYCDYRCRLYWEDLLLKQYLGGRTVWVGRDRGEARNPERRLRDSKTKIRKNTYNDRVSEYHKSMGIRTIKELNTTKRIKKTLLADKI